MLKKQMTDNHPINEIERASTAIGNAQPTKVTYLWIPGNSYDYLFFPSHEAFGPIRPRIAASGLKGNLAAKALSKTVTSARVSSILPGIRRITVEVPRDAIFDAAIIGRRLKTFDLTSKLVYTFQCDSNVPIMGEAKKRAELPGEINVPQIIDVDEEYPYFVEEYVKGDPLNDLFSQYQYFFEALDELRPLYTATSRTWYPTNEVYEDIVATRPLGGNIPTDVVQEGLDLLDRLALPDQIAQSQIHGDLHPENILLADDEVYLVDWEHSGLGFVPWDFFKSFEVYTEISGDAAHAGDLTTMAGPAGKLAKQYTDSFGEVAFSEDTWYCGLPVLYFLDRLTEINPKHAQNHPVLHSLKNIIATHK